MTTSTDITTPVSGRPPRRVWTPATVRGLGMTTDVETAGEIVGIGRSKAYELAKQGKFPVKLLRIGRRYVVPVTPCSNCSMSRREGPPHVGTSRLRKDPRPPG